MKISSRCVVELARAGVISNIKFSTVLNGIRRQEGKGYLQLVTKRGLAVGKLEDLLDPGRTVGHPLEIPSVLLQGITRLRFYSVALTHHKQQADTGTKMVHIGKNTKEHDRFKGISAATGEHYRAW